MLINIVKNDDSPVFVSGTVSTDTVKIYTSDDNSQFMLNEALKNRSRVFKYSDTAEECLGIKIWHNRIELITLPGSIKELSQFDIFLDDQEDFNEVIDTIIDITDNYKSRLIPIISIDTLINDLFIIFPNLEKRSIRYTKKYTRENIVKLHA